MPPARLQDPLLPTIGIALVFLALSLWRIATPSIAYFDEVHYLPAARALLAGSEWLNREHPPLGKLLLAGSIALVGDTPVGWRILPALFGTLALLGAMRALWFASCSRFATLAYGFLLATGFLLLVQARIAMLDVFMAGFLALAAWMFAGACREPETGRWRLAVCGVALGCALAAKWNAAPLAPLPGLAFLAARWSAGRRRLWTSTRGAPVPGVSLLEAAGWLGALPLAIYAASFAPLLLAFPDAPGLIATQAEMVALQESVKEPHTYQSGWASWLLNLRPIWYLYEVVDGAQRGVMLVGNPLTMLAGLPALAWCAWVGLARRRWDALGAFAIWGASMAFWIAAAKPIQFYYHYFVPSFGLLAALALALEALWRSTERWIVAAVLVGSAALFAYWFPVLSALPLDGPDAFRRWTWLESWV